MEYWYDVNGKKVSPDDCAFVRRYEKNGKQIGWETNGKYYDMDWKFIGDVPTVPVKKKKEIDYIAELYKKRNFVGRPIGVIADMADRGFVTDVEVVWNSSINSSAIFNVTLKDRSVYRIETNSLAQIIKAKRYR